MGRSREVAGPYKVLKELLQRFDRGAPQSEIDAKMRKAMAMSDDSDVMTVIEYGTKGIQTYREPDLF